MPLYPKLTIGGQVGHIIREKVRFAEGVGTWKYRK